MLERLVAAPLLSALVLTATFTLLTPAFGLWVLRRGGFPNQHWTQLENAFFAATVGAGLIQYLPYALGAAGVLSRARLALAVGLLGAACTPLIWHLLQSARFGLKKLFTVARTWGHADRAWVGLFVILMTLLLARALTLGPLSDDDGYHLSAPKRWLDNGALSYLPTYTSTNASMGFEMLYAIGLSLTGPLAVKVIHYLAGLYTCLGLWLVARRLGSAYAGRLLVSLLLITTPILNVAFLFGMGYVDFGATWLSVASILVWLSWRESGDHRLLVWLALCVGLAGSFKSTALSLGACWAPVLLWEARRLGVAWPKLALATLQLGVVALLPVAPWLGRSWRLTGNPLYPMLSGAIPSRDFGPELGAVFGRFVHYYSWGIRAGAQLDEHARKLIVIATLLVIFGAAVSAFGLVKAPVHRSLIVFSATFLLISVSVAGMVFRYWLPGVLAAGLVASVLFVQRFEARAFLPWLAPTALLLALAIQLKDKRSLAEHVQALSVATGARTLDEAFAGNLFSDMWRYINAETPPQSKVLFMAMYTSYGAANYGGFWVDRVCYSSDSHLQQVVALNDWNDFLQSLRRLGVTHVAIAEKQDDGGRHGFTSRAVQNEFPFGRRLVAQNAERLASYKGFELYRLKPW